MKDNHKQFLKELSELCYMHAVSIQGDMVYFRDNLLVDNKPGTWKEDGNVEITGGFELVMVVDGEVEISERRVEEEVTHIQFDHQHIKLKEE